MGESSLPDTLLTRLDELERQMRDLNQSSQTGFSSIKDGALKVLDAAGETVIQFGQFSDTQSGIAIFTDEGRQVFSAGTGLSPAPPDPVMMVAGANAAFSSTTSARPGTTSSSFTELWRGQFFAGAPDVFWSVTVFPNSGNMDFRVRVGEHLVGSFVNVYLDTGISVAGNRNAVFTIPTACLEPGSGSDPLGRTLTLTFEAKRNSGANTVDVQPTSMPLNADFA